MPGTGGGGKGTGLGVGGSEKEAFLPREVGGAETLTTPHPCTLGLWQLLLSCPAGP